MLVKAIQAVLYDRCYAQRPPRAALVAPPDIEFARRLSRANAGRERWDRGWIIHQFGPNGQVFVRKGDRERVAFPGAFIFDAAPGMTSQIGSSVSVRAPSETYEAQPGYYFAFGESLDELADNLRLTRLYFHCRAEDAAPLVSELTAALNRFQIPFQLKTPTAPSLYGRTDAAVLYIGGRYFPTTVRIVAYVREKVSLEAATPLFAKALWPGVGAAVEPGTGESFGSHRCRLMAQGIVDAWRSGEQGAPARYDARRRVSPLRASISGARGLAPAALTRSISRNRRSCLERCSSAFSGGGSPHRQAALPRRCLARRSLQLARLGDGAPRRPMGQRLSRDGRLGLRRRGGNWPLSRAPRAPCRRSDNCNDGSRRTGAGPLHGRRNGCGRRLRILCWPFRASRSAASKREPRFNATILPRPGGPRGSRAPNSRRFRSASTSSTAAPG
jgi:hypothetical protein